MNPPQVTNPTPAREAVGEPSAASFTSPSSHPLYTIERWPLGWVLCGAGGDRRGVPMDAMQEACALFPPGAVMDIGICHHLKQSTGSNAVLVVGRPADLDQWRKEIDASLAGRDAKERWWKGLDVGTSSAAMFAVLSDRFQHDAREMGRENVPLDAADFGRCSRLLALFPEWRARLPEVAAAYPASKWPALVARWAEIEAAEPGLQSEILRSL